MSAKSAATRIWLRVFHSWFSFGLPSQDQIRDCGSFVESFRVSEKESKRIDESILVFGLCFGERLSSRTRSGYKLKSCNGCPLMRYRFFFNQGLSFTCDQSLRLFRMESLLVDGQTKTDR